MPAAAHNRPTAHRCGTPPHALPGTLPRTGPRSPGWLPTENEAPHAAVRMPPQRAPLAHAPWRPTIRRCEYSLTKSTNTLVRAGIMRRDGSAAYTA